MKDFGGVSIEGSFGELSPAILDYPEEYGTHKGTFVRIGHLILVSPDVASNNTHRTGETINNRLPEHHGGLAAYADHVQATSKYVNSLVRSTQQMRSLARRIASEKAMARRERMPLLKQGYRVTTSLNDAGEFSILRPDRVDPENAERLSLGSKQLVSVFGWNISVGRPVGPEGDAARMLTSKIFDEVLGTECVVDSYVM